MPPVIPSSAINNSSRSANRSNFTFVFFKAAFQLILIEKDNNQYQVHIFQATY